MDISYLDNRGNTVILQVEKDFFFYSIFFQ